MSLGFAREKKKAMAVQTKELDWRINGSKENHPIVVMKRQRHALKAIFCISPPVWG